MNSIGIIRKTDKLGRMVIPADLREKFRIGAEDEVEISIYGDHIALKKYEPSCIFCGESKDLFKFDDRNICQRCGRLIGGCARDKSMG